MIQQFRFFSSGVQSKAVTFSSKLWSYHTLPMQNVHGDWMISFITIKHEKAYSLPDPSASIKKDFESNSSWWIKTLKCWASKQHPSWSQLIEPGGKIRNGFWFLCFVYIIHSTAKISEGILTGQEYDLPMCLCGTLGTLKWKRTPTIYWDPKASYVHWALASSVSGFAKLERQRRALCFRRFT